MKYKLILLSLILSIQLSLSHSQEMIKSSLGNSVRKNSIDVYKIGTGKNILIIISGIRGNNKNSIKTVDQLQQMLDQKKIKLPADKAVWLIPELNPDGIANNTITNANNVDLNRNFDTANWENTAYDKNEIINAGKHPFSEPETQVLKIFFQSIINSDTFPLVIVLETKGAIIIPGNNSFGNYKFSQFIEQNTDYIFPNIDGPSAGNLTNWLSNNMNIISSTLKLMNDIDEDCEQLKNLLIALLKNDYIKNFYKYGISNKYTSEIKDENLSLFLNGLPKEKINRIITADNQRDNFIKLYRSLPDKEELLLYVNKSHFIPSTYIPDDLVEVPNDIASSKTDNKVRKIIIDDLRNMYNAAKNDNINLEIISSYRSYETQEKVFNNWIKTLGEKEARRVSAQPGSSQHQLGTAIDFNSLESSFSKTREGIWLHDNAFKYGFVLSYPDGQEELTGYSFEPWHYRYISKEAAYLVYHYFDNILENFLTWYWNKKD